jgi:nucleotide-binding universal stress UspA family protein
VGSPAKILCALDGSAQSLRAAQVGASFARALEAKVDLLQVASADEGVVTGTTESAAGQLLDAAAKDLCFEVVRGRHLRFGEPAAQICELADAVGARMIVMGLEGRGAARGRTGRVATGVTRDASCPVMVVSSRAADQWTPDRLSAGDVVCGLDGSRASLAALVAAARLALGLGADLRLVTVDDRPNGSAVLPAPLVTAITQHVAVHRETRSGDPAEELQAVATAATAAAIVIGPALGQDRADETSVRLLHGSRAPVIVVPGLPS